MGVRGAPRFSQPVIIVFLLIALAVSLLQPRCQQSTGGGVVRAPGVNLDPASAADVPVVNAAQESITGALPDKHAALAALLEPKPVLPAAPSTTASAAIGHPNVQAASSEAEIERLAAQQRQESFNRIFAFNIWGSSISRSGDGSTLPYTENVRSFLAFAFAEYGVTDWIDAPCGDCNWQAHIEGFERLSYTGLDIVPAMIEDNKRKFANVTNMAFQQQDLVNTPFPHAADLVFCRDMIQHNSLADGVQAYHNIEASGAKFLVTTWHDRGQWAPTNRNIEPGDMFEVNIFLPPYNFSKPEYFMREGVDGLDPQGKIVGVWRLPALGLGDGAFFDVAAHMERARHEVISVSHM